MVPIPSEGALGLLIPVGLLAQPVAAQELADAGVGRFLLRGLEGDELVEVLVDAGGLTLAAVGRVGGAVSVVRRDGRSVIASFRRRKGKERKMWGERSGMMSAPVDVMLIPDVPEIPNLALGYEHGHTECVDGRVAETLVVETAAAVQPLEVLLIGLSAEESQVADLEIREELAVVVVPTVEGVQEPVEVRLGVDELRVRVDEAHGAGPEAGEGAGVVEDVHGEAVLDVVVAGEAEDVVVDVAEEVHVGLDAPVKVVVEQPRVLVEEARVPAAHVPVGYHPSLADADGAEIFQRVHEAAFVDPVREGPVVVGYNFVVAFGGGEILRCALFEDRSARAYLVVGPT